MLASPRDRYDSLSSRFPDSYQLDVLLSSSNDFIIKSTQYSYAYCMHSMFQKAQYKHFEYLLKTYDTIKSFVQLLVSSNDKQVISEVCSALILIIEQSSKTYNKAFSVV